MSEEVVTKLINKEPITLLEVASLNQNPAIVEQNIGDIIKYIAAYADDQVILEDDNVIQVLTASLTAKLSDPTIIDANFEHIVLVIKNIVAKHSAQISGKFSTIFNLMYIPFSSNLENQKQHYKESVPILIELMKKSAFHQGFMLSKLGELQRANTRTLAPYAEQMVEAALIYPMSLTIDVYNSKPEPYYNRINEIFGLLKKNPAAQSVTFTALCGIAQKNPQILLPLVVNSDDFKDYLFGFATSSFAANILSLLAAVDASGFVSWVPDLVEAIQANSALIYTLSSVIGYVGRLSEEKSVEMMRILFQLLKEKQSESYTTPSILIVVKNLQGYNKASTNEFIPVLRELTKSTDGTVRNQAEDLLSVAEERDLASVNQKVETTQNEIVEVKSHVDQIQKTVKEIKDKYDELNFKVQESCKSYDDLKAYMDKNIAMIKDFIAEVTKKLPVPVKFTAEGVVRRKLTLYFACGLQNNPNCLYTDKTLYTTETSDWAKWLKVSLSLYKVGQAVWDHAVLDVYDACKEIYEELSSNEDDDYISYISQPFLTSAEQDNLIEQLRDQRFFDLFVYSSQEAKWCCTKCGKVETAKRQGKEVVEKQVEAVESELQMSVGFFKRMKKVWCTVDNTNLQVLDVKKKNAAKPIKVIPKNTILSVKKGDPRVVKEENFLYLVTPKRTFEIIAETEELMLKWKDALDPDTVVK